MAEEEEGEELELNFPIFVSSLRSPQVEAKLNANKLHRLEEVRLSTCA